MRFARMGLMTVLVAAGLVASARWSLVAQERSNRGQARSKVEGPTARTGVSIQDALLRPFDLPFAEESTLEEVRLFLGKTLGGPVVLDRSALDRLELTAEDTVQLDLKGVRLKVGLQLLLDQVGMTYRLVPEDNLLILTDLDGSDDPGQRTLVEVKALHREIHDLQDAVNHLRDLVEEDLGVEFEPKKPRQTLVRAGRRGSKAVLPRLDPEVGG